VRDPQEEPHGVERIKPHPALTKESQRGHTLTETILIGMSQHEAAQCEEQIDSQTQESRHRPEQPRGVQGDDAQGRNTANAMECPVVPDWHRRAAPQGKTT
jgi:hypothetical protein